MTRQIKLPVTVAKRAAELCLSKKAFDVSIVDLRNIKNTFADFFVICSCDSDSQVRAVSGAVQDGLRDSGVRAWHVEGEAVGQWALIDCVDVVIHVFHRTAREFYNLERLWGDAKITKVADDADKPAKKITKRATAKRAGVKRSAKE